MSQMHSNQKISIVIITYNSEKYIEKCLSSIVQYNKDLIDDIVVVDNDSSDHTLSIIRKNYSFVRIVELKNVGYGAALNEGLKICKNEYLIASNDDIYFINDSLKRVFKTFESDKKIGIIGPKLLNPDLSLQHSITNYPSVIKDFLQIIFPKFFSIENKFLNKILSIFTKFLPVGRFDSHNDSKSVNSVKGAFMIFTKNVFNATAGFDSRIQFIGEEQVFSFRAKRNGFKTFYDNTIDVVHIGGQSLGGITSEKNINRYGVKYQSNLLFFKHYKSIIVFYFAYIFYCLAFLIRYTFLLVSKNNFRSSLFFLLSLMLKNNMLSYNFYKEN
tara:strand:- start:795 stop:1781 length:987 start_codon:yes stop_codon:yes gene_type:complete